MRGVRGNAFALCAGFAAIALVACGGDRSGTGDTTRATLVLRTTEGPPAANVAADSFPAAIARFTSACVAGDPAAAVPWRLVEDSVVADALPLVAIEGMSSRDSAMFAARMTRTADAIPADTTPADFRGLPVVVNAAWRVVVGEGDTLLIARSVRRVPIESAPIEETTLLLAVPLVAPGMREGTATHWFVREVAPEESADPRDLIAATADSAGVALLFIRNAADSVDAEVIVRRALRWDVAWQGALRRCGAP